MPKEVSLDPQTTNSCHLSNKHSISLSFWSWKHLTLDTITLCKGNKVHTWVSFYNACKMRRSYYIDYSSAYGSMFRYFLTLWMKILLKGRDSLKVALGCQVSWLINYDSIHLTYICFVRHLNGLASCSLIFSVMKILLILNFRGVCVTFHNFIHCSKYQLWLTIYYSI